MYTLCHVNVWFNPNFPTRLSLVWFKMGHEPTVLSMAVVRFVISWLLYYADVIVFSVQTTAQYWACVQQSNVRHSAVVWLCSSSTRGRWNGSIHSGRWVQHLDGFISPHFVIAFTTKSLCQITVLSSADCSCRRPWSGSLISGHEWPLHWAELIQPKCCSPRR